MGLKSTFKELGEFMNYRKRDSLVASKVIKKQIKQEKDKMAYYKFKKSLFEKLDEVLFSGEYSRVIIKPTNGNDYLYDLIVEDEEFNLYYEWRFTKGGELEIRQKVLEI